MLYSQAPAPLLGPREASTVRVVTTRDADGAVRAVQCTIEVPGVAPPSGYVRATVQSAGYDVEPLKPGGCDVTRCVYGETPDKGVLQMHVQHADNLYVPHPRQSADGTNFVEWEEVNVAHREGSLN